jgi:hypothetical protein
VYNLVESIIRLPAWDGRRSEAYKRIQGIVDASLQCPVCTSFARTL